MFNRYVSHVLDKLQSCQVPAFLCFLNAERLILPVVEKGQTDLAGMSVEDPHLVLKLLAKSNFFKRQQRRRKFKLRRTDLSLCCFFILGLPPPRDHFLSLFSWCPKDSGDKIVPVRTDSAGLSLSLCKSPLGHVPIRRSLQKPIFPCRSE